jgi:hypothetical protein
VTRYAALAGKRGAGNANAKVRAKTLRIGAGVAGMGRTFIQYFQVRRIKPGPELLLNLVHPNGQGRCAACP